MLIRLRHGLKVCRANLSSKLVEVAGFLARNDMLLERFNEKTRIELLDPGFKCYPADAVQADHPFPFSHGWMTVATASDFQ